MNRPYEHSVGTTVLLGLGILFLALALLAECLR